MTKIQINIEGPCKNCKERVFGCHSICDKYISYRNKCDYINERRAKCNYLEGMLKLKTKKV